MDKPKTDEELRDWFAGMALAGGLEQGVRDDMDLNWWRDSKTVATRAYQIADAMLTYRRKGNTSS